MDNEQQTQSAPYTPSQAPHAVLPFTTELAENSFRGAIQDFQHIQRQNYAYNTQPPTTPTNAREHHGSLIQNQQYTLHGYVPVSTPVHPALYNNSTPVPAHLLLQMPSSPVLFDSPGTNFKTNANGLRTSPRRNRYDPGRAIDDTAVVTEPTDVPTSAGNKAKKKQKESKPKAAKGARKQAKGKGSKSGANARDAGKSDEEVKVLSKDAKSRAAIPVPAERARWMDEEKEKALSYIVDDKRWPNFKINQNVIFTYISQHIVQTKTSEQVRQWYGRTWQLYGAVRQRQEHTGGGDGDQFILTDTGLAPIDADDTDDAEAIETDKSQKTEKKGKFSKSQLDEFEDSKLYQMLDKVAHNHPSIVKLLNVSSEAPVDATVKSEEDTGDKKKRKRTADDVQLDELLSETLEKMNAKREESSIRDAERLRLESKRHQREERALALEESERKQQLLSKLWEDYERASSSTNPSVLKRAERIKVQISDIEGIPVEEL